MLASEKLQKLSIKIKQLENQLIFITDTNKFSELKDLLDEVDKDINSIGNRLSLYDPS